MEHFHILLCHLYVFFRKKFRKMLFLFLVHFQIGSFLLLVFEFVFTIELQKLLIYFEDSLLIRCLICKNVLPFIGCLFMLLIFFFLFLCRSFIFDVVPRVCFVFVVCAFGVILLPILMLRRFSPVFFR